MIKTTSRDGTTLGFARSGTGPALLLVHGATADHRRWNSITPHLAGHFTVYAMDRRGRGASGDAPNYDFMREAEDVAAVIEAIGEPVCLLGHSYGANCGLEACRLTNKVVTLILYEPDVPAGSPLYPRALVDRMQASIDRGEREEALEILFGEIVGMPKHELAAFKGLPTWRVRIELATTVARELAFDRTYRFNKADFARFQVPTFLLLGGESPKDVRRSTEMLNSALPRSQIVTLPGQRHIAMDTDPEGFARVVRELLLGS